MFIFSRTETIYMEFGEPLPNIKTPQIIPSLKRVSR
jgi:hypothetical protein